MARIKLIVTGDMEKLALHESLKRFFPRTRNGEEVIWDTPRKAEGVTSSRLKLLSPGDPPYRPMIALVNVMFAEVLTGKTGNPADLVIVIDDVELGNWGQEKVVADHFQAAINKVFQDHAYDPTTEARYRNILRDKCSFHLLKPMVESYLFGDLNALQLAGVSRNVKPLLAHSDVEQFETKDPAWLPICHIENQKKRAQPATSWWQHERHPKQYLEHLALQGNIFYDETTYGKRALAQLNWTIVPKQTQETPIVRSKIINKYCELAIVRFWP